VVIAPSLRPYQHEAIACVRRELARVRSTMLVACTGAGKTICLAELSRLCVTGALFGMPGRVLILVHRDELVKQTVRKCEAVGLFASIEKGSQRANTLAKVVIASVQTLRGKRLARWARDHFALLIVDECHHAAAKSYQDVLTHFTAKLVGVTATPKRADGKELGETFASVAYAYDIRRAIGEQFLVPIVARRIVIESVDLRGLDVRAGDFAQDQLAKLMDDERALRGVAFPLLEQARDRSTIVFCVSVKHAQDLAALLNQYRPGCARAVWGGMDDDDRERTLDAHTNGEFQFMTNCALLEEGYDSPRASCVAMVAPTMSWARYVQRAGRGLRLLGVTYAESIANGKRDCLILDFTGTAGKHALIGPADCLRAANENIPDDLRAEIERQLEAGQLELAKVVKHAADEVRARRVKLRLDAVVNYHSEHIDPFIGAEERKVERTEPAWEGRAPTERQLAALEKQGVVLKKLPKSFSMADASRLLGQLRQRHQAGLCSYKMAKRLASLGVKNTRTLSATRAAQLRDLCLERGWHPNTLATEPEVVGERESFVEGAVA
jgi:superfamily II DNA or RNA helicase